MGSTNNLLRRLQEHKTKKNRFTIKYNINKLIYYQEFSQLLDAIKAEKKIKGWTRKKKIALIKTTNSEFKNLLESI